MGTWVLVQACLWRQVQVGAQGYVPQELLPVHLSLEGVNHRGRGDWNLENKRTGSRDLENWWASWGIMKRGLGERGGSKLQAHSTFLYAWFHAFLKGIRPDDPPHCTPRYIVNSLFKVLGLSRMNWWWWLLGLILCPFEAAEETSSETEGAQVRFLLCTEHTVNSQQIVMANDYSEACSGGESMKRTRKKLQKSEGAHLKKEEHGASIRFG